MSSTFRKHPLLIIESKNVGSIMKELNSLLSDVVQVLEMSLIAPGELILLIEGPETSLKEIVDGLDLSSGTRYRLLSRVSQKTLDSFYSLLKTTLSEGLLVGECEFTGDIISSSNELILSGFVEPIETRSTRSTGGKAIFYGTYLRANQEKLEEIVDSNDRVQYSFLFPVTKEIRKFFDFL